MITGYPRYIELYFWLGARWDSGEWGWSDSSTWGYDKQHGWRDKKDCVVFSRGSWIDRRCSLSGSFICQKEALPSNTKSQNMKYQGDQLAIAGFLLWYKYKAGNRQLLDTWTDKRMTGFRLSWKIDNPTIVATVDELGRSIQTLDIGDVSIKDQRAVLTLPETLPVEIENGTMEIELIVNGKLDQVVYGLKVFRLYKERKT